MSFQTRACNQRVTSLGKGWKVRGLGKGWKVMGLGKGWKVRGLGMELEEHSPE